MDRNRRKQLLEEYKYRKPEMGVVSFRCIETGESFLGISKDTKTDFNSQRARLDINYHPNKRLQELWNRYGAEGFELSVVKILKYDSPDDVHTQDLEALRDKCLSEDPQAAKIWR